MRKELVIPWQFKGQQGYNILMCRKWKHSFLEHSCHQKVLVVLCYLWRWYEQYICYHKSQTPLLALVYLWKLTHVITNVWIFFCVIHKTVGLHSKLAYDDIDEHWSKLVCICKLLVMYKNHKQKKQTCLSRNKIRLMRWPMWVLLSVKLFCMMT